MHNRAGDPYGFGQLMDAENRRQLGGFTVTTLSTSQRWRENCYIVRHEGSGQQVIVDPGGSADEIASLVLQLGGQLQHILLTHAHHDHVGAVTALRRCFNVPCHLHEHDSRLLRHAPVYALRFAGERIEPAEGVSMFNAGPGLRLGDAAIGVLHTPGHTAGSVCYSFPTFAFTGDTLLYQRVGRTDLPGGDAEILASSVGYLLDSLPEDSVLFPGHGRPWMVGEARAWWRKLDGSAAQYRGEPA